MCGSWGKGKDLKRGGEGKRVQHNEIYTCSSGKGLSPWGRHWPVSTPYKAWSMTPPLTCPVSYEEMDHILGHVLAPSPTTREHIRQGLLATAPAHAARTPASSQVMLLRPTEAVWRELWKAKPQQALWLQTPEFLNFRTYYAECLLVQIIILILSNGDRFASCCNMDRTLRSLWFTWRFGITTFRLLKKSYKESLSFVYSWLAIWTSQLCHITTSGYTGWPQFWDIMKPNLFD